MEAALRPISAFRPPSMILSLSRNIYRKYLNYNADSFKEWAESVGPMTERVVLYFLMSGKAPEQGYKACASMVKLSERYGNSRLENACERILAYSSTPSIRNLSSMLRNSQDRIAPVKETSTPEPTEFGITRGAAYFRKGGERK